MKKKKRQTGSTLSNDNNQQPSQANSSPSDSNSNNNNNSNNSSNNSNNVNSNNDSSNNNNSSPSTSPSVTSEPTTPTPSQTSSNTLLPSTLADNQSPRSTYNPVSTVIVGITVSVVALVVLIALIFLCWRSSRKRHYRAPASENYKGKSRGIGRTAHPYNLIASFQASTPTTPTSPPPTVQEVRESLVIQNIPHGQIGNISPSQTIKSHRASLVIQAGGQQHIDMSNLEAYVPRIDDSNNETPHQSPTTPGSDTADADPFNTKLVTKSSLKRSELSVHRKSRERDPSRERGREELRRSLYRDRGKTSTGTPGERGRRRGNSVSSSEERPSLSDPGSQYKVSSYTTAPHSLSAGSSPMITAERLPPRVGEETQTPPYENVESMTPLPAPTGQQSRGRSRSRSPLPPPSGARIQKEDY